MDIVAELRTDRDNYLALRDCLAMAAGGRLTIRAGEYPVDWGTDRPALRIEADTLISAEPDATLRCASRNPSLFAMLLIEQPRVTIKQLALVGDKRQQPWATPGYWCILAVRHAANVTLRKVRISQAQKWGMDVSSADSLSLNGCHLSGNGYSEETPGNDPQPLVGGLRVSADAARNRRITLTNCNFSGNGGQGANISRVDGLAVKKCQASNNGLYPAHGNQDGLALSGCVDGRIEEVVATDNRADGIVLTQQNAADSCKNLLIRAAHSARNGGNGILLYSHAEATAGELADIQIVGNTCFDNGQMSQVGYPYGFSGIRLAARGGFGRIHDIALRDNTCYDTHPYPGQMCGIDQLPMEVDPNGGLGQGITLSNNHCFQNAYRNVNLWQLGLVY